MFDFFFWVFFFLSLILIIIVFFLWKKIASLESELNSLKFSKSSLSVKYGKMTEQFIPFVRDFPFSPENFRFLGNPVDGVVFEEDKIIFAEFKTASSSLSKKQRRIRDLVKEKKVEWFEFLLK